MDEAKKAELLKDLKDEFDDYVEFYEIMDCMVGVSEETAESLKKNRNRNGLGAFSHYTNTRTGVLMVSMSKFRLWYRNNFKPLDLDDS